MKPAGEELAADLFRLFCLREKAGLSPASRRVGAFLSPVSASAGVCVFFTPS